MAVGEGASSKGPNKKPVRVVVVNLQQFPCCIARFARVGQHGFVTEPVDSVSWSIGILCEVFKCTAMTYLNDSPRRRLVSFRGCDICESSHQQGDVVVLFL